MVLTVETFNVAGLLAGLGLWLGLIYAIGRWGPFQDGFPLPGRRRGRKPASPPGPDGVADD